MKNKENYPIDFVITWVDDSDPIWQKDKTKYLPKDKKADTNDARYRDWGMLKYWFRAVEENAPWVNKIHFVTYGHIPAWLNISHPKIHIVKHEDFIDKKYLPTFNSCAIEVNLHKIPGLSEHFVYFNDDIFLNKKVKPSTFFKDGLPKDTLILKPIYPLEGTIYDIQRSCMQAINSNFTKSKLNKKKVFSLKTGPYLINNAIQFCYPYIVGINSKHLAQPYTKTTYTEVYEKNKAKILTTCEHRFRTSGDYSQWLFQYWQLASGKYSPTTPNLKSYYSLSNMRTCKKAEEDIVKKRHEVICINDNGVVKNPETVMYDIIKAFENRYQRKSCYEK